MKLFLQKLLTAPLCILVAFGGVFGFGLLLEPLNLPYLLRFHDDVMFAVYIFCGVLFLSVATVMVRTQHLRSSDLFEANPEKRLFVRVITSREYLTEQLVFVFLEAAFFVWMSASERMDWLTALIGGTILSLGGELVFAVVDAIIWIISFKNIQRED